MKIRLLLTGGVGGQLFDMLMYRWENLNQIRLASRRRPSGGVFKTAYAAAKEMMWW